MVHRRIFLLVHDKCWTTSTHINGLDVVVPSRVLQVLEIKLLFTFFTGGHLKILVYETSVESELDLIGRIVDASARISETQEVLERVRQSFTGMH